MARGQRRPRVRAGRPAARRPRALRRAMEKQAVVLGDGTDADVVAFAEDDLEAAVQVFHVRGGRVRGQRGWVVDKVEDDRPPATWSSSSSPSSTAATTTTDDREHPARGPRARSCPTTPTALAEWLSERRGARVQLRVPQRGDKRALIETVARNAAAGVHPAQAQAGERPDRALAGAGRAAGGARPGRARRCASSASTSATCRAPTSCASMVVFEDGLARKSEYRRFAMRGAAPATPTGSPRWSAAASRRYLDEQVADGADADGDPAADAAASRTPGIDPTPAGRASSPTRRTCVVVDGGAPQVAAAAGGARRTRHRRRRARRAGQAARGGLAAGRAVPGDPAAHLRGALPAAAGARRGAPVRDHLPPAEAVEGDDRRRRSTASPASARPGARRCCGTSARSSGCGRRPSTRSPRCRASAGAPPRRSSRRCAASDDPAPAVNVDDRRDRRRRRRRAGTSSDDWR